MPLLLLLPPSVRGGPPTFRGALAAAGTEADVGAGGVLPRGRPGCEKGSRSLLQRLPISFFVLFCFVLYVCMCVCVCVYVYVCVFVCLSGDGFPWLLWRGLMVWRCSICGCSDEMPGMCWTAPQRSLG